MRTLTLKSYNKQFLDNSFIYLKVSLEKQGIPFKFLNRKKSVKKITLLKSPHVYKKFKEHYAQTIHSLVLQVPSVNSGILSLISSLNAQSTGVYITII